MDDYAKFHLNFMLAMSSGFYDIREMFLATSSTKLSNNNTILGYYIFGSQIL